MACPRRDLAGHQQPPLQTRPFCLTPGPVQARQPALCWLSSLSQDLQLTRPAARPPESGGSEAPLTVWIPCGWESGSRRISGVGLRPGSREDPRARGLVTGLPSQAALLAAEVARQLRGQQAGQARISRVSGQTWPG